MSYNENSLPPSYPISPVYPLPMTPDISNINDYLPWSIANLLLGYGLFGIIPIIFSNLCRKNKDINNMHGAQTMSTLALVFNIFITIGGIIGWTIFIVSMSIYYSFSS
jgi:hypothetical protein